MTRFQVLILTLCLMGSASAAPDDDKSTYVDLQSLANQDLSANMGRGSVGNNLSELPRGEQTFNGVKFKVENRFIQLGSPMLKEKKPDMVEGIKIDAAFARLEILQGTLYGKRTAIGPDGKPGGSIYVPDGTRIARYEVHYEDGSREEIPVVYGQDVRDWWITKNAQGATRGKVAWEGDNPSAKSYGHRLRLHLGTWENPHPEKKVTRIDFEKADDALTAPFCIALTLERE